MLLPAILLPVSSSGGDTRGWLLVITERRSSVPVMFHPLLDEFADIDEREKRAGVLPGTPILISPKGEIDQGLVRFFNSPHYGSLGASTRSDYAKDIRLWVSYLWSRATPLRWTEATDEHLLEYATWRRRKDINPAAVGGNKWDRELAALTKLYGWATRPSVGLVTVNPIERETLRLPDGTSVEARKIRPLDGVRSRVTWATPRTYRQWRDVGLLGYAADGTRDERWAGRNSSRNRAFTDLLFGSGLRSQEASTLLTIELPPSGPAHMHEASLAERTAKRRARRFYMLDDSLRLVNGYIGSTRRAAVARARANGRYDGDDWLRVTRVQQTSQGAVLTYDGTRSPVGQIQIPERARLLRGTDEDCEPLWLWLKEDGLPFQPTSWDSVFDAANARVADVFGDENAVYLTAHTLRHSYALYMLVVMHQAIDRKRGTDGLGGYEEERYRQAWDLVRDFLGHATTAFTQSVYLEPLDGIRMLALLSGGGELDDVLGRLAVLDPRVRDLAGTP